jgi:hypothetical protein
MVNVRILVQLTEPARREMPRNWRIKRIAAKHGLYNTRARGIPTMKINNYDGSPQNTGFRWALASLVLTVGLSLSVPPGYSQESNEPSDGMQTLAGKKKHRKRQTRPIMLGSSGSNAEDWTISGNQIFCCKGTLGALVEKSGIQYILSNNHVLGRSNSAKRGEAIIQPGLFDIGQSCPATDEEMDTVAHFTARKKIRFGFDKTNRVDMALAEVVPGAVRSDGELLQIGVPGSSPLNAFVGLEVKKSGRTTGLTHGFVESVHNTVIISDFPLDCGGEESRIARFEDQIFIRSINNKKFEGSGDSGSMVYEDVDNCPSPVGLLFAGGGGLAAINPASTVLKIAKKLKPRGKATFVGCESSTMQVSSSRTPILREAKVREASAVKREWQDQLLNLPNVQSLGIGMSLSGPVEPAVYIYTTGSREEILEQLPERLDGISVEVIRTDKFVVRCGQDRSD